MLKSTHDVQTIWTSRNFTSRLKMEPPSYAALARQEVNIVGLVVLLIVVVMLLIFALMLAFGAFDFIQRERPPRVPLDDFPALTWDIGASTNGQVNWHNGVSLGSASSCTAAGGTWNEAAHLCQCAPSLFGPNCNLAAFDPGYYAGGQAPLEGSPVVTSLGAQTINGVSFGPTSATTICNNLSGCNGFVLTGPTAATFFSDVTLKNDLHLPFIPENPPVYYFKQKQTPKFPDRVFLYRGDKPLRYWLLDRVINDDLNLLAAQRDTVYELHFVPEGLVNDGNLIGLISDQPFAYTDLATYVQQPRADMIKFQGNQFPVLPTAWRLPYYIAFTTSA